VAEKNPFIGFPYPRLMNSNAFTGQAAALILTSVAKARELGIPQKKRVLSARLRRYLRPLVLERPHQLPSSLAMRIAVREAFEMTGTNADEMVFPGRKGRVATIDGLNTFAPAQGNRGQRHLFRPYSSRGRKFCM